MLRPLALLLLALALAGSAAALPPAPSAAVARVLGQYGPAEAPLTIYEMDGRLFADGHGLHASPLPPSVRFEPAGKPATAVVVSGERLARHDFGAETVAVIQAKVKADPAKVRALALAASPPTETGKRPADLVDLTAVDRRIRLDIRYATANNFMGFPLYERASAYLQRPAAEALGRVQKALAAQGYGLMIHDAYRPWYVTKMFWEATPPDSRVFVADPAEGSKHNRGCAVDLTLYELGTGKPVEMPSRYDEMSTRSYADFVGGASRQRALRQILRIAMEAEGFTVLPQEWWHFDYKDWPAYGIGTATFTELAARP
ncbi:MAG: M15 family metallopeptidase [Phenylobacterium sp.]